MIFLIEMAGNQGSMAIFTGVPVQTFDIMFLYISISILVSATHIHNLSGHGWKNHWLPATNWCPPGDSLGFDYPMAMSPTCEAHWRVTRPKKWISVPLGWPQLPGLCSFSKLEFHWVSILFSFDVILQSLKLGRDKNLRFEGDVWREGPIVAALCGVVILWWLNLPWTATGKIQRLWDPTGCVWKPYDMRWYSKAPDLRPNFWLAQTPWLICVDCREVAACLSGLFRV